jgi:hypothetical protein
MGNSSSSKPSLEYVLSYSQFADAVVTKNLNYLTSLIEKTPIDKFSELVYDEYRAVYLSRVGLLYYYLHENDFNQLLKIIYDKDKNIIKSAIMLDTKYITKAYSLENIMGAEKFNSLLYKLQYTHTLITLDDSPTPEQTELPVN